MSKQFEVKSSIGSDSQPELPPLLIDMLNVSHLYLHSKNEKCVFNQYGQCVKGFRYFCPYCNYGIGGMFSNCPNSKCDIPKNDNLISIENND